MCPGANESGRGGQVRTPLRGSLRAAAVYVPGRKRKRPRGAGQDPPPGVTTCGGCLCARAQTKAAAGGRSVPATAEEAEQEEKEVDEVEVERQRADDRQVPRAPADQID